jgi:hypothetical protein
MTGTCDLDCVAPGPSGNPLFEIRVDVSIFCRYYHPTRFAPHAGGSDDGFELVSCVEYLRLCHKGGQFNRKIGCKLMQSYPGQAP